MSEHEHTSKIPEGEKERFLDRQENVDRLLWGVTVVGVILLLLDFVYHRHIYHSWEHLWGFYGIFGAISIIVLVQAAKGLRKLVMRDEDHYESD
jgi:hypothetical protein